MELMAEDEARESAACTLPIFGEGFEADVLCEKEATKEAGAGEEVGVCELCGSIFLRGDDIHPSGAELECDGGGDVNVEVERGHPALLRRAAMRRKRRGDAECSSARSSAVSSSLSSVSISSR